MNPVSFFYICHCEASTNNWMWEPFCYSILNYYVSDRLRIVSESWLADLLCVMIVCCLISSFGKYQYVFMQILNSCTFKFPIWPTIALFHQCCKKSHANYTVPFSHIPQFTARQTCVCLIRVCKLDLSILTTLQLFYKYHNKSDTANNDRKSSSIIITKK